MQVLRAQGPCRLLQAQVVEDVVVAAVVVVAHRGVQLALGVEHIDDVAGTHLVADLGGFQRALVGDDRLLARLHLFDVGVHRAVQVTGVLHHLATQAFALLFGLCEARIGFANLRTGQAATVDRNVQLQADAGLLHVTTVMHVRLQLRVGETEIVVVTLLVFRHGIKGRRMAGLALAYGLFGGRHGVVGRQQVEVLPPGGLDPGLGVVGGRHLHRQGVDHALDRAVLAVGQGDQGFEGILHLALGDDPVGPGSVVAGLRLQHVGLVRKADVEAFVGLVQLALEGRFFSFGRGQVVLGAKHGEVVLGSLQDQVLLGGRQFQRGLFVDGLGGLQLEPAVGTEDWLRQGGAPGVAAAVGGDRRLVELGPGVHHLGTGREVGEQAGAGLGHHFAAGAIVGTGGGQVGVVVDRFLVDADQVGLHRRGRIHCPGHSVGRTRHGNCQ